MPRVKDVKQEYLTVPDPDLEIRGGGGGAALPDPSPGSATVWLYVTYPDAVTVNTTISLPRVSHVTRRTINKPTSSSSFSSHFPFHLGNFIHLLKISIKKGDGKIQGNATIDLLFDSNSAFVNKMKVACLPITTGVWDMAIKQSGLWSFACYHVSRAGTLVRASYKCMWDQSYPLVSPYLLASKGERGMFRSKLKHEGKAFCNIFITTFLILYNNDFNSSETSKGCKCWSKESLRSKCDKSKKYTCLALKTVECILKTFYSGGHAFHFLFEKINSFL